MAATTNGTSEAHTNGASHGASHGPAGAPSCTLREAWALRNASAQALLLAEAHMQRQVEEASVEELIRLIEEFSPTRSTGPEWTRTFEPLVERLWAWCDDGRMAALEAEFTARGMPWMAVANALTPERGAEVRAKLRQPAWARVPAFTLA
ncbi:MAG: hypothetical protein U0893_17965 [Chloroflexota bacterium]